MSTYSDKLRRFEFTSVLGWSYSRFDLFGQCKRKYYYQYYGKCDIENAPKINVLKNLTTIPLEVGIISHDLIQRLLKRLQLSAEPIDLDKFFSYAERETIAACKSKTFEDIYYRKCDEIDFKLEVFSKVSQALENFIKSDRLQWLFEEALVNKEDWIIELDDKDKYGECRIDNLNLIAKWILCSRLETSFTLSTGKPGRKTTPSIVPNSRVMPDGRIFISKKTFRK